jgi:hypothetical protein
MQPNRAPVTYKSFYRHKSTKTMNSKNFLDDDIVDNRLHKSIYSKKCKQMKKTLGHPNIHRLKT